MASYTPGSGLKKPMNMLENPVYPDIKKGPPRFVWSRKHWNVDVGATLRDTEPFIQFIEPAVLAQSRSYNTTVYGQSSHKDIVNAEFRPPLLSPYEDLGPLTRVPATIHAIIPRINPSTAGHGSGTSGYTAKNERVADVAGALTDRVKAGEWRPTFYAPMEVPMDNSVLPDLEVKMPSVSIHAGWNIPIYVAPQPSDRDLGEARLGNVPIHPGHTTSLRLNGQSGMEKYQAHDNRPAASVTAGANPQMQISGPGIFPVEAYELRDNRPNVSVTAGSNPQMQISGPGITPIEGYELGNNRPNVSVTAGANPQMQISGPGITPVEAYELKNNRPNVSVTAGANPQMQVSGPGITPVEAYELRDNRPNVSVTAGANPQMQISGPGIFSDEEYELGDNRPNVSVTAGMNTPLQIDAETRVEDLMYNRPQVSVSAGMNVPMQLNAETRVEDLLTKLGETPVRVLNPGSETGFKMQTALYNDPDEYIQENRPAYSYTVPSEVPAYRSQNSQTHRPHFRERLQPDKSYGQISHSGGSIPRSGVERPRNPSELGSKKKHPYSVSRKKSQYRF